VSPLLLLCVVSQILSTNAVATMNIFYIIALMAVPDLLFSNPAGAGCCRIWNDKSGRSRIFKLTVILQIQCVKHYKCTSDLSFDYFLCSSYCYIIYTHSRSNLCHSNVSLIGKNQLDILGQECIMSGKINFSNPAKLSGSGGIFAGARFMPD